MADSSTKRPTLFLIDGYAQLYRAYHAIRSQLSSPVTKEPTNATFGFVGMLLKVLREYRPDYLAIVIDIGGDHGTFRSQIYPEYKANREPPPLDFRPQVDRCLDIARMMGIPVLGAEGFEADDVLATITTELAKADDGLDIRIVSRDKDLEQLLGDRVALLDVHKDEIIDVASLEEKKGIEPSQVIDVLALMGDNVDNVPGVDGVGPKTAAKLIQQYGTLENLLDHLDEIKGKRRERLEEAKAHLPLSKTLVTLRHDVETDFDLDASAVQIDALPVEDLLQVFRDLGFGRYQDELRELVGSDGNDASDEGPVLRASANPADAQGTLFDIFEPKPSDRETKRGTYRMIATKVDLDAYVATLKDAPIISVDTETTSHMPRSAKLCGVSLSIEPETAVYIPIMSPTPERHLDLATVMDSLRPVLEDPSIPKCGHHIKYDLTVLRSHGIHMRGVTFDTMIASYVVDSDRSSHSLTALAKALLNYECIRLSDLIGERARGKKQGTFDRVPLEHAVDYAAEDADLVLRLRAIFDPQLNAMKLRSLFDDVEMPLVDVLAEMEFNGITVDPKLLDEQRDRLNERIEVLRDEIMEHSPHHFNPDSPKQLAAALFNGENDEPPGLGLRVIKRGKTGPSTDIEVLEKLAADETIATPIPKLIVEYRQLTKLVNTYLVTLTDYIHPETKRIHASFHQTVAATGRLASSDPNLQNIPIRTDVGREIRRAFVAKPGAQLITADYSQIELRLLAHLSEDEGLIAAFQDEQDIHTTVAAEVYGVAPAEVTREQRNSAKMVNFGIVYGITPFGLARRLGEGVSNDDAARIINDYKAKFSRINQFLVECVAEANSMGYVSTMLGRRRDVPQVKSRNPRERALGERVAINSVVQGSAADLIKLAMIDLHRRLPEAFPGTKLLLQIHDELVFEAEDAEVDSVLSLIIERMEAAMDLKVPLRVSACASPNWLEAK